MMNDHHGTRFNRPLGCQQSYSDASIQTCLSMKMQPDVDPTQPKSITIHNAGLVRRVALVLSADRKVFNGDDISLRACACREQAHDRDAGADAPLTVCHAAGQLADEIRNSSLDCPFSKASFIQSG